jgi:cellulose synthase operon protein C
MALADEWIASEQRRNAGHNMKAYVALVSEQLDVAATHIQTVLKEEPKNSLARLLNASLSTAKGDTTQAEQQFKSLLDDEPQNSQALEQYLAFSRANGNIDDVTKRLEKAHKATPLNYQLTLLLANAKHSAGEYKAVLALLNSLETKPHSRTTTHWAYLIDAQLRLNNPAQALQSAREWYDTQPSSSLAAQAYMQALYANKDFPAALTIIDKLLATQPEHVRFINIKLQILDDGQLNKQLIEFVNNLSGTIQQRPEVQFYKGKALAKLEQYPAAEKLLLQSYTTQPTVKTVLFLAELQSRAGDTTKATSLLEQHIATYGSNAALHAMLAQLSLNSDTERAISAYQTMLNEQPENVLALNNLAWLMLEKNDTAVALKHAKRAFELRPDHPDVLDTYGKVLLNTNDIKQATAMFEASLKARPNTPQVQLHYAEALARSGNKQKALTLLEQLSSQSEFAEKAAELKAKLGL